MRRKAADPRQRVAWLCATLLLVACLAASAAAQRPVIADQSLGEKLQQRYLAVTREWTEGVTFTRAEREAMKIPYWPEAAGVLQDAGQKDFEAAHRRVRESWLGLLSRGAAIQVPEKRVNDVWRALLLQNFILADGPRFTYGSSLPFSRATPTMRNSRSAAPVFSNELMSVSSIGIASPFAIAALSLLICTDPEPFMT